MEAVAAAAQEPEAIQQPEVISIEAPGAEGYLAEVELTEEDNKLIDQRAASVDLKDNSAIMTFGADSQKAIADFSDNALQNVRTKDLGEVSDMISDLVVELKGFSLEPEKKGLFGLFQKGQTAFERMKAQYSKAEVNIDRIVEQLQSHQNQLSKDVVMLDKMYEANLAYYKDLTLFIMAGKKRLEQERATTLVELKKKAEETGLAEDAQAANDYASLLERFEKKIYDLELTRAISIQMAPQIRLIQSSDIIMVEKIQTTLINTIPLWKNQMVLALGMEHVKQATEAQREVTDVTNELLRKNAETLKQGTIAVAQEAERSIVEIETVQETNQKLIETFDEVLRIQAEGREKRANAENELGRIEAELKNKLLEIKA